MYFTGSLLPFRRPSSRLPDETSVPRLRPGHGPATSEKRFRRRESRAVPEILWSRIVSAPRWWEADGCGAAPVWGAPAWHLQSSRMMRTTVTPFAWFDAAYPIEYSEP